MWEVKQGGGRTEEVGPLEKRLPCITIYSMPQFVLLFSLFFNFFSASYYIIVGVVILTKLSR